MKRIIFAIVVTFASLLIFVVMVAFVSASAFAENAETNALTKTETKSEAAALSISGNVIDEISGEALVGVEVKLEGSDVKTYTDFDGHFVIENVKAGDCKLVASYTSYKKKEKSIHINKNNSQVKIELQTSK